jgi:cytochrome c oxidase cbb3-type subunit 1
VVMMVTALTVAGIVEARLWQADTPWLDSVRSARPYWLLRTLSAIPITAGFVALLAGLTTGPRGAGMRAVDATLGPARSPGPVPPALTTVGDTV